MSTATTTDAFTDRTTPRRARWIVLSIAATVFWGVAQVASSRADDDPAIRELWLQDLTAILVLAGIAFGVSYVVMAWAHRGGPTRHTRTVTALAIIAIVATPLFWYSAAPVILAGAAATLGTETGVTQRHGGSSAARVVVIIGALAAVATFAVVVAGTIAEIF